MQSIEVNSDKDARTFVFPASVTIENIESLTGELKKLQLSSGEKLTLDVEQTEVITTPGIQLILALTKTIAQSGDTITITKSKETFNQSFDALGLPPAASKRSGIFF